MASCVDEKKSFCILVDNLVLFCFEYKVNRIRTCVESIR